MQSKSADKKNATIGETMATLAMFIAFALILAAGAWGEYGLLSYGALGLAAIGGVYFIAGGIWWAREAAAIKNGTRA